MPVDFFIISAVVVSLGVILSFFDAQETPSPIVLTIATAISLPILSQIVHDRAPLEAGLLVTTILATALLLRQLRIRMLKPMAQTCCALALVAISAVTS